MPALGGSKLIACDLRRHQRDRRSGGLRPLHVADCASATCDYGARCFADCNNRVGHGGERCRCRCTVGEARDANGQPAGGGARLQESSPTTAATRPPHKADTDNQVDTDRSVIAVSGTCTPTIHSSAGTVNAVHVLMRAVVEQSQPTSSAPDDPPAHDDNDGKQHGRHRIPDVRQSLLTSQHPHFVDQFAVVVMPRQRGVHQSG